MRSPRGRWTRLRLQRQVLETTLRERNHLRLHGAFIGGLVLALTWGTSALLRHGGVHSLALRYLIALAVGYAGYLLMLRWWARQLLDGTPLRAEDVPDAADLACQGAQAIDDLLSVPDGACAAESGEASVGVLDAVSGADEGALVVVPVLAIFAMAAAFFVGAGAVAWLFFGSDVLLAVAVELAFAAVAARATVGLERTGWLGAALRLTYRPMLVVLLCAAVFGAAVDHWLPEADTLAQAARQLRALINAGS